MEPKRNLTNSSSAAGSPADASAGSELGGWGWLAVCAAVIGAVLVFGSALGGMQDAGKWLALLLVLPCAIMCMCMRRTGGNQGDAGNSNAKTDASKVSAEDGR